MHISTIDIIMSIINFAILIGVFIVGIVVYFDAKKVGFHTDFAIMWALISRILPVIGLLIYLVRRAMYKKAHQYVFEVNKKFKALFGVLLLCLFFCIYPLMSNIKFVIKV